MRISFLDIVWWIVRQWSRKIIYSSSFGEMVRMGTGSVQIVPDLILRKKERKQKIKGKKRKKKKVKDWKKSKTRKEKYIHLKRKRKKTLHVGY